MQPISGSCACEQIETASNQSRPPGLVAGSEAGTIVGVEIFVEEDVILPMRIVLELLRSAINRAFTVLIAQENAGESSSNLLRYFKQSQMAPRAGWAFNLKV